MTKKCKHENTEAIYDPLNTYYGISYCCIDCGEYINIDNYKPETEVDSTPPATEGRKE